MVTPQDPADVATEPSPTTPGSADPARRILLRGAAAVGLATAAGIPLAACGSDSTTAAGGAPAPASTPLPSKSDVFRRTAEPRPARTRAGSPQDERAKVEAAKTEPSAKADPGAPKSAPKDAPPEVEAGSRSSGDLATARKGEADVKGDGKGKGEAEAKGGRATKTPTPEPTLPPGGLAFTSDIPVGGGKIFEDQKVVVTQPTKGTFKGFSATCTHRGCVVERVEAGSIVCLCHNSRFSIVDGAVQQGPAGAPLPPEVITVADGSIRRG